MKIDAVAQDESTVILAAARAEFDAEVTYLDTASFGLPPRRSWMALQHALAQWRAGTAAQAGRGIRIREVPLERIAACVTPATTLVAVSAVQSADGRVADLDALYAATRATGARVLLDTTRLSGGCPSTRAASPTPPAAGTNGCCRPGAPPTSPSAPP